MTHFFFKRSSLLEDREINLVVGKNTFRRPGTAVNNATKTKQKAKQEVDKSIVFRAPCRRSNLVVGESIEVEARHHVRRLV